VPRCLPRELGQGSILLAVGETEGRFFDGQAEVRNGDFGAGGFKKLDNLPPLGNPDGVCPIAAGFAESLPWGER